MSLLITLFVIASLSTYAQDTLLLSYAKSSHYPMTVGPSGYEGVGWELIQGKIEDSKHVLIGEEHFTNEIPPFIEAVADAKDFKNFYIEIDPYTTALLERHFKNGDAAEQKAFKEQYGNILSFYSLKPEYDLLKRLSDKGMALLGSDQIVMYDDRLLSDELSRTTKLPEARVLYDSIAYLSEQHLETFFEDHSQPMYMLTDDFEDKLNGLLALPISAEEKQIVKDLLKSRQIYMKMSHRMRVNLIIRHLMETYPQWKDSSTLFKYGANHLMRGESFMGTYDIGNVVANLTESNDEQTLHIMIAGMSGYQGGPFPFSEPSAITEQNTMYLKPISPFISLASQTEGWSVFNLRPLREAINKQNLQTDRTMERLIKGYDLLVLIPEVSAAGF